MIELSTKWASKLAANPETGMGYQIATVVLKDGRKFDQVAIVEGRITMIRKCNGIPFNEDQIDQIVVTHEKWIFDAER